MPPTTPTRRPETNELPQDAIEAVVYGHHGAPFDILGPHNVADGVVVRAFLPQAATVALLLANGEDGSAQEPLSMDRIHPHGLYELFLPGRQAPFDYRLEITGLQDQVQIADDPYNFPTTLTDFDKHLFGEGSHLHVYQRLGAHLVQVNGRAGVTFVVWAPLAPRVSVIGDFNNWDGRRHPMRFHHENGLWELFIPGLTEGTFYKYEIKTRYQNYTVAKSDPFGFYHELRPNTASIVWNIDKYEWRDSEWLAKRTRHNDLNGPISVYEVHPGSWQRKGDNEWLTYPELAERLIPYVKEMGYSHIELMPIAEHPYDGSWGYQVTGYFAPTSRFGTPEEFMAFVDACHQAGIGVILDWVPAHFPKDEHGLAFFDGTHLYEHADPRRGEHPDWGTLIFNYGRNEVRQFLISNAVFWLEKYHIDGLRVDAVASMIYLDFSRKAGEWLPNQYGGRENLEAIDFIRAFNERLHEKFPDVLTIAEESTAWPGVTHPVSQGGLGFDLKWNMGWMHDTLQYMSNDPVHRAYHHGTLTFSLLYAFSERFLLPFSHDEVVHLKKSMLDKMPGDAWRKFANLRALYAYQYSHPGKKMLFMGGEFGQWREWTEKFSLDWHLLESDDRHKGLQRFVRALNHLYRREAALYRQDNSWDGFAWIDLHSYQHSLLAYSRQAPLADDEGEVETVYIVCNFTPVIRAGYRLGVNQSGHYGEILNSDDLEFGGSGVANAGLLAAEDTAAFGRPYSLTVTLPPLGVIFLKHVGTGSMPDPGDE
jgi:1,4-alpha-glucan branching enzyme